MNSFTHNYLSTDFPLFVLVVRFRAKSLSTYKERSVCAVLLTFVRQQSVLVGVQNRFKLSLTWKTEGIDPNRRKPTSRILGEKQRAQEKTDTTAHKGLRPTGDLRSDLPCNPAVLGWRFCILPLHLFSTHFTVSWVFTKIADNPVRYLDNYLSFPPNSASTCTIT